MEGTQPSTADGCYYSVVDGWSHLEMGRKYTAGIRTRVRTAVGPLFEMLHIYMVWLGFAKHIHIQFGA